MEAQAMMATHSHADSMFALIGRTAVGFTPSRKAGFTEEVGRGFALAVAEFLRENDSNYKGEWPRDKHGNLLGADAIFTPCRKRVLVEARAMSWAALKRTFPNVTVKRLGRVFKRDHATVLHNLHNHRDWCGVDPVYRRAWEDVRMMLGVD